MNSRISKTKAVTDDRMLKAMTTILEDSTKGDNLRTAMITEKAFREALPHLYNVKEDRFDKVAWLKAFNNLHVHITITDMAGRPIETLPPPINTVVTRTHAENEVSKNKTSLHEEMEMIHAMHRNGPEMMVARRELATMKKRHSEVEDVRTVGPVKDAKAAWRNALIKYGLITGTPVASVGNSSASSSVYDEFEELPL